MAAVEKQSKTQGQPRTWILTFEPDKPWTENVAVGSTQEWRTAKVALINGIRAGDRVLYWQQVNGKDPGGLVGHGYIASDDLKAIAGSEKSSRDRKSKEIRFETHVLSFQKTAILARQDFFDQTGISEDRFSFGPFLVNDKEITGLERVLSKLGIQWPKAGLSPPNVKTEESEGPISPKQSLPEYVSGRDPQRDDAISDIDYLGRAPLAIDMAQRLHTIWLTQLDLSRTAKTTSSISSEAPGFVAHIDAPWGGGKTSFANMIGKTLSPPLDGQRPEFLSNYCEGDQLYGMFLRDVYNGKSLLKGQPGKGSKQHHLQKQARRPWIVVNFNAWQNQHIDPPWWNFYSAIRKQCFSAIRNTGLPLLIERQPDADDKNETVYELKRQYWFARNWHWLRLNFSEYWWRFWTPATKLGLFAFSISVIALILMANVGLLEIDVLKVKLGGNSQLFGNLCTVETNSACKAFSQFFLVPLFLILGGGSAITSIFSLMFRSLLSGSPEAAKNYSLGFADPLARFRSHFSRIMRKIERPVLVIIDDLDRCDPSYVVQVISGLQTIVTSPRTAFLILGDRSWIEQAFQVHHDDMKEVDVGPRYSFGGRFLQKAIQLSYVLPTMDEQVQQEYYEKILEADRSPKSHRENSNKSESTKRLISKLKNLLGWADDQKDDFKQELREQRKRLRRELSQADSGDALDQKARELAAENDAQVVAEELVIARGGIQDQLVAEVKNDLEPLGEYLPANPRHIKRIVNSIVIYQSSLILQNFGTSNQGTDNNNVGRGSLHWRQLAIGVVLMTGYPEFWKILVQNPNFTSDLIKFGKLDSTQKEKALPSYEDPLRTIAVDSKFVALLHATKLPDEHGANGQTEFNAKTVEWLNKLIPVTGS